MRYQQMEGSSERLEEKRREINDTLRFGFHEAGQRLRSRGDAFGPPYGFASVGDFYGQNTPGFWDRRRR